MIEGKPLQWPDVYACEDGPDHDKCVAAIDDFNEARKIPVWGIFVVVAVSIISAEILHRLVEVPCRHLLRTKHTGSPNVYVTEMSNRDDNTNTFLSPAEGQGEHNSSSGIPVFSER